MRRLRGLAGIDPQRLGEVELEAVAPGPSTAWVMSSTSGWRTNASAAAERFSTPPNRLVRSP